MPALTTIAVIEHHVLAIMTMPDAQGGFGQSRQLQQGCS
jgi:hypothetical protein